ncbi:MAG TPA: DUF3050 domain-containing protein [Pirellulales bacterium]|nr:DUF3050 domain-containing protein [Pirellulales bacterium]
MNIDQIRRRIAPARQALLAHPLYADLAHPAALRVFMQHHVFAVWDFMSLLKTLQLGLTTVSVPWLPASSGVGARLVNEIVLAEESDADGRGGFASHFELYTRAMRAYGTSTADIDRLLARLRAGEPLGQAFARAELAEPIRRFVAHTFALIDSGDLCRIAAAFTFGREDLLPDVFQQIVDRLSRGADGRLDEFQFYLQRHIQLDGEEHGALATQLVASLCGDDPTRWQAAEEAAVAALAARRALWDAIHAAIRSA